MVARSPEPESQEPAIVWLFMLHLPRFAPAIALFRRFPNHEDLIRGIRMLALKIDSREVDAFIRAVISPGALKSMPAKLEAMAGQLKAPVLERRLPDGTLIVFQRCVLQDGGAVKIIAPKGVLS